MKLVVRKIARAKWDPLPCPDIECGNVQADAITSDLRTSSNKLSIWGCESEDKLEDVALALASIGNRIDNIDLAWIEFIDLEELDIPFEKEPGNTHVQDMKDFHLNIVELDLERIGKIACKLASKIREEGKHKRIKKTRIKDLLADALNTGKLSRDDLDPDLLKKIVS